MANGSLGLGCSSNFDPRRRSAERAYCIWPDAVVRRGGESRFVRAIVMAICIRKYAGTEKKHSLFSTNGALSIALFALSTEYRVPLKVKDAIIIHALHRLAAIISVF